MDYLKPNEFYPGYDFRLLAYSDTFNAFERSYDEDTTTPIGELFTNNYTRGGGSYTTDLFLEYKLRNDDSEPWAPYTTNGGVTLTVYRVDLERASADYCGRFWMSNDATIGEMRERMCNRLNLDQLLHVPQLRIVAERFSRSELMTDDTVTLKRERFYRSTKVYLEFLSPSDANLPYEKSELARLIDHLDNRIRINVTLPDQTVVRDFKRLYSDRISTSSEEDNGLLQTYNGRAMACDINCHA